VIGAARAIAPRREDSVVAAAIARTPQDLFVVWTGEAYRAKADSLFSRTLSLVSEVWTPVPLRALVLRAAEHDPMLRGPAIRDIVRQHQGAKPCAYLLLRRTPEGGYCAVTRIPWPPWGGPPIHEGALLLDRHGQRPVTLPG